MTQRRRTVPEGYVDEAVIEKLMSSFGAVMNECLPTGSEIATAAVRILIMGLHVRLTDGDPSATTSEMQARLEKFGGAVGDLMHAVERGEVTADDDLEARQQGAQVRILYLLRELNLIDAPSISPVIAALAASMMLRVPPEDRLQVGRQLDRQIAQFLQATPAGVVPDHDA